MTDVPTPIDLQWLGGPRRIAAWRAGDVLVDCGPATTVDTLLDAIGDAPPRALLLTHIHFDHAGAAGELVRRWPDLEVVVHERGARHLADPARLEASARRVFGAGLDELFGALVPIPEANLTVVAGGERVHGYEVLATPGHAVHHVAYLEADGGRAFPGDLAAMRLREGGAVLPPTPPPDIDVDVWLESISALRDRAPSWLGLPHFGAVAGAGAVDLQLRTAAAELRSPADAVGRLDVDGYVAWATERLGDDAATLGVVSPLPQNHAGLTRWLRREDRTG